MLFIPNKIKKIRKKYLSRHHNSRHGMPWKLLPPLAAFFSHIVIMLSQQLTAVSTSSRCCSFRQARDCSSFKSDRDNCKPARGDIMSCAAWATVSTDDDVGARGSSCCCCLLLIIIRAIPSVITAAMQQSERMSLLPVLCCLDFTPAT